MSERRPLPDVMADALVLGALLALRQRADAGSYNDSWAQGCGLGEKDGVLAVKPRFSRVADDHLELMSKRFHSTSRDKLVRIALARFSLADVHFIEACIDEAVIRTTKGARVVERGPTRRSPGRLRSVRLGPELAALLHTMAGRDVRRYPAALEAAVLYDRARLYRILSRWHEAKLLRRVNGGLVRRTVLSLPKDAEVARIAAHRRDWIAKARPIREADHDTAIGALRRVSAAGFVRVADGVETCVLCGARGPAGGLEHMSDCTHEAVALLLAPRRPQEGTE